MAIDRNIMTTAIVIPASAMLRIVEVELVPSELSRSLHAIYISFFIAL